MKTTMTVGAMLATAFLGCYALPARTTPVQSAGLQLSVPGVYCALPEYNADDYGAGGGSSGELGAQVRIENTTDAVATIDTKDVRVVVNEGHPGEIADTWSAKGLYEVAPHSTRVIALHVKSDDIECSDAQAIDFSRAVLLDGKPIAIAPLKLTSK
jgi:hypothetical protein